MDDFIKKQEEAFKKKKDTLKQTTNDEIYAAYQERNKLIAVMNNVAKKGDYLIYKNFGIVVVMTCRNNGAMISA